MRTVFVTGAEGFVGSHVLGLLRERGYDVVAGVRNRARKLTYERQQMKALVCDVADAINVARVVASVRPDAVLHLAGVARASDAARDPLLAYQSIVSAWANVLDAVRRTAPRAKVVLASACEVYGNAGRDGRPLPESTPPQPSNTFGSLKRAAETIAATFFRDYHLDVTIARPFHYTGAGQPETFFLASVARQLLAVSATAHGQQLVLSDLECRRDVLDVRDVASAYQRLVEDGRPNETYNICSGQSLTCREMVAAMATQCGLQVELTTQPEADGDGRISTLCGDNTRLREELGWKPAYTLQDALRELVNSARERAPTTTPAGVRT